MDTTINILTTQGPVPYEVVKMKTVNRDVYAVVIEGKGYKVVWCRKASGWTAMSVLKSAFRFDKRQALDLYRATVSKSYQML